MKKFLNQFSALPIVASHTLPVAGLFLIGIGVFFSSFSIPFTGDNLNHIIEAGNNILNIGHGYYRPVSVFTLWLDKLVWGNWAGGYHLSNFFFHYMSVVLIYFLILELKFEKESAFWGALLFLALPIHEMNLYWISGRTDVVCAVFYLTALLLFIKFYNRGKPFHLYAALVSFFLSLFSKEMAVSLPFVFYGYIFLSGAGKFKQKQAEAFKKTLPFFLMLVLFIIFRALTIQENLFSNSFHAVTNPFILIKNMIIYMGLLTVPGHHLEIALLLQQHPVVFKLLIIVAILFFIWLIKIFYKDTKFIFLLLFMILSLLPVLRLVMRWYLYIPSTVVPIFMILLVNKTNIPGNLNMMVKRIVLIIIGLIFIFYLKLGEQRWLTAAETAESIAKTIAEKTENIPHTAPILFLNSPSEISETPALIFGLQSLVHFHRFNSLDNPDSVLIYPLTEMSLRSEKSLNQVNVSQIDSVTFRIDLADDGSYFSFPRSGMVVSGMKRFIPGELITNNFGQIEIIRVNPGGKPVQMVMRLSNLQPNLLYYSHGSIHRVSR